ncbi:Symplekin tight junction protein C terminal-domain-containing protein [Multifurca ochricompacta]|uniref:Symplekin tight junction protein C terminal-domain-containing protein n=1 Tax=Multifurca ochricompacta TaxID=376703 RepID=A0AAD4M8K9_9AGAM|nr:Symplekin tight junction protein C terminal-domain-containing protein [Multifurca ochricompacta]
MASMDPLQALTAALSTAAASNDSLLRRWVLELLHFGIARAPLAVDTRTNLALQSLDIVSVAVQTLAGAYPLLFRRLCTNRNERAQWDTLTRARNRIIDLMWAPNTHVGVQFAAVKFLQKVILVQSRGIADPRLQDKNDPNLAIVPGDHPFINAAALEAEGATLLHRLITDLYTKQNPDLISAILNSWSNLVKLRPSFVQIVVSSLTLWTPVPLSGLPFTSIKSVEKSVRILLTHISRSQAGANFAREINDALTKQAQRMEQAAVEERTRRAMAAQAQVDARKRPPSTAAAGEEDAKRQKLEADPNADATALLSAFDFTTLPVALIAELIEAFQARVNAYRHPAPSVVAAPAPVSATTFDTEMVSENAVPATMPVADRVRERTLAQASSSQVDDPSSPNIFKEELVDPLQMDMDEDIEYEPDRLNLELEPMQEDDDVLAMAEVGVNELLQLDFQVPPPSVLGEVERAATVKSAVTRIRQSSGDLAVGSQTSGRDMWILLLVRMITRVVDPEDGSKGKAKATGELNESTDADAEMDEDIVELYERQDKLRRALCDYIMADFSARIRLATTWMNEEWYHDQVRLSSEDNDWRPNYEVWLNQIVARYQSRLDRKDRMFARFLLDLPSVPSDVFTLLRDLCTEPDRCAVDAGRFQTLRDFVTQRPTLRGEAMTILLELTTHPEKVTRNAAILTVKRCMSEFQMTDGMIRDFALQLLRRLQTPRLVDKLPTGDVAATNENMEDGQLPPEDLLQTPYLPERLELPAQKSQVVQHVELLFALSSKVPDFLDEIFAAYGEMDTSVQEAIQDLITALIRSLGPGHGKLLTLMRTFPPGAETLALLRGLIAERDLDARFLIPIIAEMDKPDIMKHLPRIETKELVRSVFGSVVTTPPQTFGSVTSNLPRVRQSELLTPAELMVLLHDTEKEIGIKSAIEAIGICFSMTDVFRSEILAVVMQQILDEPVLPTLFMRTVIQAVKTYKSLTGFVSTTLLSRLITKKIWTTPLLWEGFIRCAQIVAPASFLVLLQLPKEQLRELVAKQPSLRGPLREFVQKKGGNPARAAVYLEIIGGDEPQGGGTTLAPAAETPLPSVPSATPTTAEPTPS